MITANAFLLDMDGVICRGSSLIKGAASFLQSLIEQNRPFLLLTNNSAPTPKMISEQLQHMGANLSKSHIYTAALATATWAMQMEVGNRVMVLGEAGLEQALVEAGFILTSDAPDWVAVGECRHMDYEVLCIAAQHLLHGARLVGTNPDPIVPKQHGVYLGCGAVVAALECATGQKATFVGKPEPFMYQLALERLGVTKEETVMVGDNMITDILGAHNAGLRSALVLSGVTSRDQLTQFAFQPTWVIDDVRAISL